GFDDLKIVFHHLAHVDDAVGRMIRWARRWARWLPESDARSLAEFIRSRPHKWCAAQLGEILNLHGVDRDRLKVTTIRAVDRPKEEQDQPRKQRKAEAKRENRRHKKVKPRAKSEANPLTNLKPGEQCDPPISRRTWERRRNPLIIKGKACRK